MKENRIDSFSMLDLIVVYPFLGSTGNIVGTCKKFTFCPTWPLAILNTLIVMCFLHFSVTIGFVVWPTGKIALGPQLSEVNVCPFKENMIVIVIVKISVNFLIFFFLFPHLRYPWKLCQTLRLLRCHSTE